jgi:tRNA threonylcarbamoyladenosine biosynthesis protein TsaB
MSLVLSIETAANGCSVAIHREGVFVAEKVQYESRSAAEQLTVLIQELLAEVSLQLNELSAIAVSKGPGSYTGLRIGVSTAKGLCYASDLPLISVNTLDIMALDESVKDFKGLLCPMLDARRMEVYCKVFRQDVTIEETQALILDQHSFGSYLEKDQILFFGSGAGKFSELIKNQNAVFISQEMRPQARNMGKQVYQKYKSGQFEDVADFEPFYLKEFMMTAPSKSKKVVA